MRKLIHGLHHFQQHIFSSKEELFQRLSKGQNPEVLFITCSDSRVDPGLITNTEPGDLFVLRNAGNIIPAHGAVHGGEIATIEFAVLGLDIKDIIICGHSHCGAMKGLLEKTSLEKLPMMNEWLTHAEATRYIVRENYHDLSEEEMLDIAIQENVLVQLEHLRTIPFIAAKLLKGDLHLHGWVYSIETGDVNYYDAEEGQFLPLTHHHDLCSSMISRQPLPMRCI